MHLPSEYVAAGSAILVDLSEPSNNVVWLFGGKDGYVENWSSLIGIITAIVGNVLISFALNTQRYAHIRLEREWQAKEKERKRRIASSTSLSQMAANGSKNGKKTSQHPPRNSEDTNGYRDSLEASESDPLIPQSPSHTRPSLERDSSSSSGDEEAYKQKSYLKSPYWWVGIILMTIGETGNFLAYGFAPASIVSPLGVVALISNCMIAPFMLKEPFRWRDALGVVIAVGGAVTVVLSASDNNPKLGPGEIWDLITTWEFETYLGITIGVIAVLMVASNKYGAKNILIDLGLVGLFGMNLCAFLINIMLTLLGGYTALSTKGVSSLLSYTLWRVITFPVFYLLVAILIGTAIMQIKYVNRALQRFDATQVIPVQFVLFTLSVILGSAVLYRDFERTSGEDAGKFVGGCAMTFLGVWFVTTGRPRRQNDDDEDREPESDDAINLSVDRYRDSIDSTHNEALSDTRRSSTLRSMSPIKQIPSYRDEAYSRPTTPRKQTKLDTEDPHPDRPATAEGPTSILANPWSEEGISNTTDIPTFQRHTSTPVLPSEAAPPPVVSISDSSLPIPQTPPRQRSYNDNVPTTPGNTPGLRRLRTNERIATMARNSLTGPFLASPLSTTLSAMVQDMKRGGSIRNRDADGSMRRRGSVLGLGAEDDDDLLGAPLDRRRTGETDDGQQGAGGSTGDRERPEGRGRSLSGTLNELWRGIKGTPSRESIRQLEAREDGAEGERR